ncbi:acetyl-CoA carboxylase [Pseudonocardia endophytica]|uniref:Biotin carboxyl carrier protein of acetyl-CoA carboxylase n=1 Tax=Pseudonocardia endophytica TaxID=401976 RepID=A0A4R1HSK4_PSEEN|nr:acetyl-CoA carboxylase [Pseudonocardia endophytica]TCK25634.1 biotin-dependent enzyme [Pseudonocardia endophytica]
MARHEVVSPIPGVFYRRPDPDSPEYVKPGQTVDEGETIGLVEVMKSFHPIVAGASGTFGDYVAEGEAEVDAGETVAHIEVDG